MGLLSIIRKIKRKEKEMRILMVGLDNSGKTTIVLKINGEDTSVISPTLGFNIKTMTYDKYTLNIWDVGGQKTIRSYWRNYFEQTDGLVWVVDSSDLRRLDDCKFELDNLLKEEVASPMEIRTTTQLANFLQFCIDKKSHINGKLVHAHILRTGLYADTFLSNRLIDLYDKCGHLITAHRVFDKMPQKNLFSWHAMLTAYSKTGDIDEAHKLFVKMPERNSVSWNTLISAFVRGGLEQKALNLYYDMNKAGFLPTNFTLASVFSACGALLDLKCGCVCHGFATKIGLDKNIYVGNALLSMYAKCGNIANAIKAFEDLTEVNEVSFTAMMGALGATDHVNEAFHMFRSMHRMGIQIDAISMSSVIGVCASSNVNGQQLHSLTIKHGLEKDLHLSNSLLDMYAKEGDMESAEMIFSNLQEVSVVSWNVMIGGYGQKHQIEKAVECMQMMQRFGFDPDEVTYINMLTACLKSGDTGTAHEIFNKMACPSLDSWNALLSGYSQIGKHKDAIKIFRNMQFNNVKGDRTTFAVISSSCASMGILEGGKQVHAASIKTPFANDIYVASGLIGMYSKCNKIEMAKCIFYGIKEQDDIVCWNSMIAGLSLNNLDNEAFMLFKIMLESDMQPTQFSYATVLSSCAKLSSISHGRQIHAHALKNEILNDIIVGSALIDMYSKCGEVNDARLFFDTMAVKNTITWNEMIHGYAQNGRGEEGVVLFEEMINRSDQKPDSITFIAVLTACSHSGLIDHGITIFNSMKQEHGVEPLCDHYTCIIDCLGRAGRFDEIEVLLDKMPYVNDPILWEVLLSSCRVHLNVSLAKRAADELFRLNPCNSAPYVLLANMYSSLGRWDDVRNIRELMIEKKAVKDRGYSWFEHKDEIQELNVADNVRIVDKFEATSNEQYTLGR